MSDTPRTESFNCYDNGCDNPLHAWGAFSAELERELNTANEMFRKLNIHTLNLTDRINRLEEAGDVLCAAAAFMGWHMEIEKWNKAKEVKL